MQNYKVELHLKSEDDENAEEKNWIKQVFGKVFL